MLRLTSSAIRSLSLPEGTRDKVFFDSELAGFGLRLRDTGARSWLVQYAVGGRTRRMTLGSPETVDPGKAREAAKDILARVRLGQDPAHDKQASRQEAAHTFGALIPRFLQRQRGRLRLKSFGESTRHLTKDVRSFHALPITRLDRRTIATRLSEIAESNGPAAANRVRSTLSAICSWATREGLIESNPVAFTNLATENGPRNHLLSNADLAAIWSALGDDHYSTILKLLIFTGARRDEIASLRWSEIDLDKALISLPPERTKNKRGHIIPLSTAALDTLTAQVRSESELVFGTSGRAGFQNWTISKRRLDAKIAASGAAITPWVLHDFRRLISTTLHERLAVPPHIVEAILAHAGGHKAGVAGTYNLSVYLDERRRALQRWSDHMMSIVAGVSPPANAIALRT
jgi:integrase